MYIPILGALALAGGTVFERFVLKKKKIGIRLYQTACFLAIVLAMLPFIYFFWRVDSGALTLGNILILGLVILLSLIANAFVFYSMKWEKISNLEPARIMEPIFTILLAIIFSYFIAGGLYSRNSHIVIPAFIAAFALIFSHMRKHHVHFNKYFLAAIVGSFFFAAELVVSQLILSNYSPLSFYFIRSASIFLVSLIVFRPNFGALNKKIGLQIFITGAIWVVYRLAVYYGYQHLGIISTTLVILLGPVFIYFFAWKFLKEKLNWKNIVAAIVIVGAVLYGIFG